MSKSLVGQVRFDPAALSTVEFSEIVVNARTFTTGSDRRDRAIRGPVILDSSSEEHELIVFEVTRVEGLSSAAQIGSSHDLTLAGDLTIKGTTQQVTFDLTVTRADETTLRGSATAEITREMFEIGIPSVPNVADVSDDVLLGLEFVAQAR